MGGEVHIPRGLKVRRLHKAFLRYHDPNNWPMLRAALQRMGRADLIGNGPDHLVPTWQPRGTGQAPEGARSSRFTTQHLGLPTNPPLKSRGGRPSTRKAETTRKPRPGPR